MKKILNKTKKEPVQHVLCFALERDAIRVSLSVGEKTTEVIAKEKDALLGAVGTACAALPKKQVHPDVIVVSGKAERFSESRSVATIANALAYAWNIPVFEESTEKKEVTIRKGKNEWPIKPNYSSEPHITKPKQKVSTRS